MSYRYQHVLFWFRRDLRLTDNAGLYHALKRAQRVSCVFVFDREILDVLPNRADRRVDFILGAIAGLKQALRHAGSDLWVRHAHARTEIPRLSSELKVQAVFTNEDYEPASVVRDTQVAKDLGDLGIGFHAFKDHVIFAKDEVLTQAGKPYTVFTPYKNAWLKKVDDFYLKSFSVDPHLKHLAAVTQPLPLPTLQDLGFNGTNLFAIGIKPSTTAALAALDDFLQRIDSYHEMRDFPAVRGVSYLSVQNRFGTVSIRHLARLAWQRRTRGADTWLSELIWRDFYFQILHHFPHVASSAFKPEYDKLAFRNDASQFEAWCLGQTGYPIVDAAMRQLNQTGYMHNRLRMITASFLTKDLLIDWRWGEKYFADHLNDFDLAANNGGWQWAASTGCDAQPYFRIFNPVLQAKRFDPQGKFIRRYVPELTKVPDKWIYAPWLMPMPDQQAVGCVIGRNYPVPLVDHDPARKAALAAYKLVTRT